MSQPPCLAVIGGGFSGAALAAYLLRRGQAPLDIQVIDPRPELAWGVAYGDAAPFHILNVPSQRMSLWGDQPDGFLDWARTEGPKLGWPAAAAAGPETYLPRRLFGHYVAAELAQATESADGPRLIHRRHRAVDLRQVGAGYQVQLDSGEVVVADAVVLATGFRPPALPFPVKGASDRLIADPWATPTLPQITRDASVLIIGTGLSMVDMIYSLTQAGHRGRVTALSRHGYLPLAHGVSVPPAPVLGPADLERGISHALRTFRAVLRTGKADWRSAIDSLRPITDTLWRALPAADQRRFLRHLGPFWEVHRHRMPAESADLLLKRVSQGRLNIVAGRLTALDLTESAPQATYRRRGHEVSRTETFGWVINCTPPAAPFDPRFNDLPQALIRNNLARPHPIGLGFSITPEGVARNHDGDPVDGLFVLGPPRRGQAMEATAVPHIRPQLESLTAQLLARVSQRQPVPA